MQPSGERMQHSRPGRPCTSFRASEGGRMDSAVARMSASIAVPATTETLPTAGLKPETGLIRW